MNNIPLELSGGTRYLRGLQRNLHLAPLTPYYILLRFSCWLLLHFTNRLHLFAEGGQRGAG